MLAIKQPLPPSNFMTKGKGYGMSGFMGKHPFMIRGAVLHQMPYGMPPPPPRNTLERKA